VAGPCGNVVQREDHSYRLALPCPVAPGFVAAPDPVLRLITAAKVRVLVWQVSQGWDVTM